MKRLLLFILLSTYALASFAQVSGGSFSATSCATGDVNWTNPGVVNNILIFAKVGSAITVGTPTSNVSTYTANSIFGSGTAYQGDAAAFCIYKSSTTGTTTSITNLTPGITYHFLAYDVNGTTYSASHSFSGSTPSLANVATLSAIPDNGQIALNWTNPSCFDQVLIVAKPSSTIAGTPTGDGTAYNADPNFGGAGTTFDAPGKVVYKNNTTSETISGLTNGTTYFFRAFTRKGTTWSAGIEISATPYAPATAGAFNTNICLTTGTASWTNPATVGTILVFAKAGSAITAGTPTSNIATYTADADFSGAGTAYQNDASAKCIYKGTGATVNLTGLASGIDYHFLVFNATNSSYSTSHSFNGSTLSAPPNASGLSANPSATSISLAWTNPSCFDEVLVVAKTATIGGTPTGDGTLYPADPNFAGSGAIFDTSGKVVFKGAGTSVNVTNLTASTTYFLRIFTRKGTTWSAGAEVSAATTCTPTNATGLGVTDTNTTATVSWTNSACLDEVMIVAKQDAAVSTVPTGNGTAYTANLNFTSGSSSSFDGGKVVYKGSTSPQTITNLTVGNVYYFTIFTRIGTSWSSGVTISTATGPPLVTAFTPVDNSTGILTNQVFTITFNENVSISASGFLLINNLIRFDKSGGGDMDVNRNNSGPDGTIAIVGNVATITLNTDLTVNTAYDILVGNRVFQDGSDNQYVGTSAGDWNITTAAGVTITAPTIGVCSGQYSNLGDIVIAEAANNNFNGTGNGSFTFILGFDKAGYAFKPGTSGVSVTVLSGGDIQSVTVNSIAFSQASFTIQFNSGNAQNDPDQITITGLKVSTDGSTAPPALIQVTTASTMQVGGINKQGTVPVTTLATINGGSVPSAPVVSWPSGKNSYCTGTDLSSIILTASAGTTYNWYADAGLNTLLFANQTTRTAAQIFGASPGLGTFIKYVTNVNGCESPSTSVVLVVTSLPTAAAGSVQTVCPNAPISVGGSPTATGGSGSYVYSWSSSPAGFSSSASNPTFNAPLNATAANVIHNYAVTVTDANSCTANANVNITVKTVAENVLITQPNTTTYTTNNQPVDLVGSPTGGTFSGVGVTQLNGSYKFDPKLAGVGTWPITYAATLANGCAKSIVQNFYVSAPYDVFTNLEDQYCNNEGIVALEISATTVANIQSYINTWNTVYVPNYGYSPLKATFTGIVRNEYEAYYGANNSVQTFGGTYTSGGATLSQYYFYPSALQTDQAYPTTGGFYGTCASCTYAYVAVFLEFLDPTSTSPYNIALNTDQGYYFRNSTVAAIEYNGEYVYVNPTPIVSFSGLQSSYCNVNTNYTLTGNKSGGSFEISNDGSTFGDISGDGIKDVTEGIAPGLGEFNPQIAFGGAASPTNKWIRYSVDPGTFGSDGVTGCIGKQDRFLTIYPSTPITFPGSVPANNTEFCYEGSSIDIVTSEGAPPASGTIVYSGFGISDNGNGNAKFTPRTAFDQKNPGSLTPETMTITAIYTNAQSCSYPLSRNFIVRPKPLSAFTVTDPTIPGTPPDFNFCYNDPALTLLGNSGTSVRYEINYVSLGYTQIIPSNTFTFDPSVFYDNAVAQGGSNVSDATFNITYIVTDAIGCSASSTKVFSVSPLAIITISGINDGDKYCSNAEPFPITFSPISGTLEVNGSPTPLNPLSSSISSNSPLIPIGNAVTIKYEYRSGVSQCLTSKTYTISKIDAPLATFSTTPICDGDPATFTAGPDPDNYTWKWILGDSIRSGTTVQSINHVFSGLSQGATQTSYLIRLIIENSPSALKTCRDSAEAIQIIGAYPKVDFNYAKVCEDDFTKFNVSQNIPISSSQWDFGDSFALPNSTITANIPVGTHGGRTQGKYGEPEHRFSFTSGQPNRYTVMYIGRTPANVGACPDTVIRNVAILEKLEPTSTTPYSMANLDNGAGLWIQENRSGSSIWEFGSPSGKSTITNTVGNVWITKATGPYTAKDYSFLNSPCFDLSNFQKPVISLQYWNNTDIGKDGAILQYSTDGGQTWNVVGSTTSGVYWYNNTTISSAPGGFNQYGWTGRSQSQWLTGKNSLDVISGNNNVRFRIAFASDERDEFDGFALNNVSIEERNRTMLVEHFSNDDATGNATSKNNYNVAAPLNDPLEVVKIQYQTSFPGADPINAENSVDHNARAAYYGVTSQSVPLGFIDGGRDVSAGFGFMGVSPSAWWFDFKQKRSLSSSPYDSVKILTLLSNPEEIAVNIKSSRIATVPGNKPVLHVAIVSKQINNNEYVLRKFLPNAAGKVINKSAMQIDETFSWKPEGLTLSEIQNLAIIAFIQDEVTKEVHQSWIERNPTNLPTSIVTDTEDRLYTNKISTYPNPANHEVSVVLPAAVSKSTPVTLTDGYGRVIYENYFAVGQQNTIINTATLAGGVYILQIGTPNGSIARKKVLIVHQ